MYEKHNLRLESLEISLDVVEDNAESESRGNWILLEIKQRNESEEKCLERE